MIGRLLNKINKVPIWSYLTIALVLRVICGVFLFNQKDGTQGWSDSWDYIEYAQEIITQNWWPIDRSDIKAYSPPFFPYITALFLSLFGQNWYLFIILNSVVSTISLLFFYLIAKRLLPAKGLRITLLFAVFYFPLMYNLHGVVKEAWVHFFLLLSIWVGVKVSEGNRIYTLLYGVVLGLFIHLDERYFLFMPLYFLFIAVDQKKLVFSRRAFSKMLVVLITLIVMCTPWMIRNIQSYNRPVFLTERLNLFIDPILGYSSENSLKNERIKKIEYYELYLDSLEKGYTPKLVSSRLRNLQKEIDRGAMPHTFSRSEKWKSNFIEYWRPVKFKNNLTVTGWKVGKSFSMYRNLVGIFLYLPVLLIFFIGLYPYFRNYTSRKNMLLNLSVAFVLMHGVLHVFAAHGLQRYRIQIDMLLILVAFSFISHFFNKIRRTLG